MGKPDFNPLRDVLSGVIMAAEMQMKAAGADVAAALQQMVQSPMPAAATLQGAHQPTY